MKLQNNRTEKTCFERENKNMWSLEDAQNLFPPHLLSINPDPSEQPQFIAGFLEEYTHVFWRPSITSLLTLENGQKRKFPDNLSETENAEQINVQDKRSRFSHSQADFTMDNSENENGIGHEERKQNASMNQLASSHEETELEREEFNLRGDETGLEPKKSENTLTMTNLWKLLMEKLRESQAYQDRGFITCDLCKGIIPRCPKRFSQKVKMHILSHLNEKPYQCPTCSSLYRDVGAHMSKVHAQKPGPNHEDYLTPVARLSVANTASQCFPEEVHSIKTALNQQNDSFGENMVEIVASDKIPIDLPCDPDNSDDTKSQEEDPNKPASEPPKAQQYTPQMFELFKKRCMAELKNNFSESRTLPICGKCERTMKDHSSTGTTAHVFSHMGEKAFFCLACETLTGNLRAHRKAHHKDISHSNSDVIFIRPEVADVATKIWFECFPQYSWILDLSEDELKVEKSEAKAKRTIKVEEHEEVIMSDAEREICTKLAENIPKYASLLRASLRKSVKGKTEFSIPCAKCKFSLRSNVPWSSTTLREHSASHMKIFPFKCCLCGKLNRTARFHFRQKHKPEEIETISLKERNLIRPEAAREALQTLFECFPGFEHIMTIPLAIEKDGEDSKSKDVEPAAEQMKGEADLTAEELEISANFDEVVD